jgi:hypothetical protein
MAAKSWQQVALECMRRPGVSTPYFPDSYAPNEARPFGRRAGGNQSSQYDRAVLVMGRYLDSRAFSASTNPDYAEIGWRSAASIADLSGRAWNELLMWSHVYVAEPYTAAILQTTNKRLVTWDWRMLIQSVSTGQWTQIAFTDSYGGHLISPDFRFEYPTSPSVDSRIEASGYRSVRPVYDAGAPYASSGFPYWAFHGYGGGNQFVTASDVAQIVVSCKHALVLHSASGANDLNEKPFAFAIGADAYPTPRTYDYPSVGCSRHLQTAAHWPDWQFCVMHTMTEAQLNAPGGVPPIFRDVFESYDPGGTSTPAPVVPAGPAPSKGRWVSIYNPTSPKARWAAIAASVNVLPQWQASVQQTAAIGVAFTFAPILVAGTPAPTYSKQSGPAWASVNTSTGVVTGTPTGSPTSTTIVIRATNAAGTADLTVALEVVAAPTAPVVVTTMLPNAEQNAAYFQALAATGTGPLTWSLASGTLPAGLALSASGGVISGTPTALGASSFTVRATGPTGLFDDQALSLTVSASGSAPDITTTSLADATQGSAYSQTLAGTGATPRTWAVVAGALPPGLTLNTSTGAITGTPTVPGGYPFTARLFNAIGASELQLSIRVLAAGATAQTSPWTAILKGR